MSGTVILLIFVGVMGALFGFVYLIEQKIKSQGRTGKPSRLIRISAIVVGLLGIVFEIWHGIDICLSWFLIPGIIILMGYGIFGLFATGSRRPPDMSQEVMGAPENVGPIPRKGLARKTKIIIGFGTAIITVIVLICAGAGYFVYTVRDSEILGIEVDHPETVHVGDSFELTINLKNTGEADIEVQDIDLSPAVSENYDSILAGATVTRTEPAMKSNDLSILKMRSYHYNRIIKPGETHKVIFYLQAVKPGGFHTDVDIYLSDGSSTVSDLVITIAP